MKNKHILSLLVEDTPGLLTRVSGLFARRGFNISSLAVGKSEKKGISRLTLVCDIDQKRFEQLSKQLHKLINVIQIKEINEEDSIFSAHMLIKVNANAKTRGEITDLAKLYESNILSVTDKTMIIETTGSGAKFNAFLKMLAPYGILEIARSGTIALKK